jgi:uncharacterized protein YaaW (UPF0174 family)
MASLNRSTQLTRTITVFVALTIVGVGMTAAAGAVNSPYVESVLMHIGSAIFGAGLAFFLVDMFHQYRER